jgi:hypothetical protein
VTTSTRAATRPTPIYVLGDSHAAEFNLRLYDADEQHRYLFLSAYAPGFAAAKFAGPDGAIAPVLAGGVAEPFHRTSDPHWSHFALVEDRPRTEPPIVVSIGGLDIVHFGVGLREVDDIALPPELVEPSGPLGGEPLPGALPFEDAVSGFAEWMQPVARGLRDLREHGFERLALLSLAPPTPHDDAFRAVRANLNLPETPSHATLAWRSKCALVANAVLARVASEAGIAFIDRWRDQVRGGVALPGMFTDWMHLSAWAVDATAAAIIAWAERSSTAAPPAPPAFYQVFVEDGRALHGVREYTVAESDFVALRGAPADAFVVLNDVNERSTTWVNASRIVSVVPLRLTAA